MYNFFTFEKKNIIRNHNKRKLDDDKTKLNTLISFTLPACSHCNALRLNNNDEVVFLHH